VIGPFGQRAALAVCGATERVVFNAGAPSTRFMRQAFPRVINVAPPVSSWTRPVLAAVRSADRHARKVAMLVGASDVAAELTSVTKAAASGLGFEVTSGVFQAGRVGSAAGRLPPADVLLVHGGIEDEVTAAGMLLRRPWRAAAFSTFDRRDVGLSLVELSDGLLAPRTWSSASDVEPGTGPSARDFVSDYIAMHGTEPTTASAWAFAAGLIFGRCVRYCGGIEDTSVLAAARGLETSTLLGRYRVDHATGLQVGHTPTIVQRQAGTPRVVWPREAARAPLTYPRWQAGLVASQR
jgi:hypothetical protein